MLKKSLLKTTQNLPLLQLQCRAVRDLAWALTSPSLFEAIPGFPPEWFLEDYLDSELLLWLAALDAQPETLYQHLSQQRSTRLGIYFEQLLSFYFEYYPRFELLAKNLQVNDKQRTLGEFDFIIKDGLDGKVKHIEAAVKFYLGHDVYTGKIKNNTVLYNWHNWVGPNQKDSLAIKMRHLKEHQLTLANTIWGKNTLEKNNIPIDITSRLLIRGCFYYPAQKTITGPRYHNINLPQYYWLDDTFFLQKKDSLNQNKHYCILPRSYWLSPIKKEDIEKNELVILSSDELRQKVKKDLNSEINEWQISELDFHNKNRIESKRFFIVNSQNLPFDK